MPVSLTMGIGEIRTLTVQPLNTTISPPAGSPYAYGTVNAKLAWTNNATTIVQMTVSADGLSCTVMGLAAGSATITAAIVGTSVSDTFTITVPATSPDTLALSTS